MENNHVIQLGGKTEARTGVDYVELVICMQNILGYYQYYEYMHLCRATVNATKKKSTALSV